MKNLALLMLLVLLGSACSQVEPWDRDILSREGMLLVPDAMEAYAKEHVYFSKEAATGGRSVGGGGCGCN